MGAPEAQAIKRAPQVRHWTLPVPDFQWWIAKASLQQRGPQAEQVEYSTGGDQALPF